MRWTATCAPWRARCPIGCVVGLCETDRASGRQGMALASYQHAFDGLAKLVSFEIGHDGVRFSTRFLRTDWYNKMSAGAMPPSVTTGPVSPPWSAAEGGRCGRHRHLLRQHAGQPASARRWRPWWR